MEHQGNDQSYLENADIKSDLLTLRELCKRRKILLQKKEANIK